MQLWNYRSRGWAERMWKRWYGWAIRSRLEPVKKVARMIKRHWDGVIDAVLTNVTNARSEATNAKIQWIKRLARARPLPGRAGYPHEILKRLTFVMSLSLRLNIPSVANRWIRP